MTDRTARRWTMLSSDRRFVDGEHGPADAFDLASSDWLHERLAQLSARVDEVLDGTSTVVRRELTLESRIEERHRAGWPPAVLRETALVVRLVVRGAHSQVPVLWQAASTGPVEPWLDALGRDLPTEVRAAAVGTPLAERERTPVVLDPWLAAQLVHECIGHTSEADNHDDYAAPSGRTLGYRWTELPLTVIDDPSLSGHRASFTVDDEGERTRPVPLVTRGVWTGLLHSRATASASGVRPTGHGRRVVGAPHALPRMSVTVTVPGSAAVDDLIGAVGDGLYCAGTWGGGSSGDRFVLRPSYARRIRDGRLTDTFVRRFDFRGDKFAAIGALTGIGRDVAWFDPAFGCDKFGQDGLPVSFGCPHLGLREIDVVPFGAAT